MRRCALVLVLCLGFYPMVLRAETVSIVADQWCPYNCEPNSAYPGFMIEIARAAFAKHAIEISYSTMPWTRAIEETRAHKHTAIIGASRKDAPDFIFPSAPQGLMRNHFYVKKDDPWRYSGIASLSRVSLGVIADYSYGDVLDPYIAQNSKELRLIQKMSGNEALDNNVKKLLAGRVGAVVESESVMDYYRSKKNMMNALVDAGALPPSDSDQLFIAFSPQEPNARRYAEMVVEGMRAMRANGEFATLLNRYGLKDWKP